MPSESPRLRPWLEPSCKRSKARRRWVASRAWQVRQSDRSNACKTPSHRFGLPKQKCVRKIQISPTIPLHSEFDVGETSSMAAASLMNLGPQNRAPIVTHDAPDLAELLGLMRAGHAGAARQLHRILSPGVRFLLRRRL